MLAAAEVAVAVVFIVVVVPFGVGLGVGLLLLLLMTLGLSLVAATAAALARAVVASLADLASAIVLFDARAGAGGLLAAAVSVLALLFESLDVSLGGCLSSGGCLSVLSLGLRMAEGGLWVMGAKSSCCEMTDATECAMAK